MEQQRLEILAQQVETMMRSGAAADAVEVLSTAHPADLADLFQELSEDQRAAFLATLSPERLALLLDHLEPEDRGQVVNQMPRATLARVLDAADGAVAADILHSLPPAEAARVLSLMSQASEVLPLLAHSDESAGGLMTRRFIALHKEMTVQEALNYLRLRHPDAEEAYYLYVMDGNNRLEGVVSLRSLVVAPPNTTIENIMNPRVIAVAPGTDQEECARIARHYSLRALPVLGEERQLLGVIGIEDLMAVEAQEATEDMYRMVGIATDERALSPVLAAVRRRLPWLTINVFTAFLAAFTVSRFESTIAKVATLAVFMPVIAGQGGNAGVQTITLVVRALALGEIGLAQARQVLLKEIGVGLVNGLALGLLAGTVAWAWTGNGAMGLVVAAALWGNMVVAGLGGALAPLTLRLLRLDPALSSGIFVTALTDVMGFLLFLGLATIFIGRLG
ncbi:MAG TPA: magnesium transporter [Dehalococcoidia bacterium]|nr:magnesium transporter [Dehalococcoidia bacterium]HLB29435.1 magnesium transporter [Dehalococcoidia bacterium]